MTNEPQAPVEQVLVVGLGNFGMGLARALVAQGSEVVAVDRRQDRVHRAAAFVTEAVRGDAVEQDQLARLGPNRRDLCVVAIGDESLESSILCTTLLRQMGAKRVIARATSDLHERILNLVGAHEVVNPERSFGEQLAAKLTHRGIVGELALGPDLVITELETPPAFGGRTLAELSLAERFGVTVVAVRRGQTGQVVLPAPTERLQVDDVLVVVSDSRAAQEMLRRV